MPWLHLYQFHNTHQSLDAHSCGFHQFPISSSKYIPRVPKMIYGIHNWRPSSDILVSPLYDSLKTQNERSCRLPWDWIHETDPGVPGSGPGSLLMGSPDSHPRNSILWWWWWHFLEKFGTWWSRLKCGSWRSSGVNSRVVAYSLVFAVRNKQFGCVNWQIWRWIPDHIYMVSRCQAVFALQLSLAAICRVTSSPDINVNRLPCIGVIDTLLAEVLISEVFLQIRKVDNLQMAEPLARACHCQRVTIIAWTSCFLTPGSARRCWGGSVIEQWPHLRQAAIGINTCWVACSSRLNSTCNSRTRWRIIREPIERDFDPFNLTTIWYSKSRRAKHRS